MRLDPLKQYAKLRQQLLEEKSQLETRLSEINQVLGSESPQAATPSFSQAGPAPRRGRRGRRPAGSNELTLRDAVLKALAAGPLARKELVSAVQNVGYEFSTRNPLNSIGAILYGKNTPVRSANGKYFLSGSAAATSARANNGATSDNGRRKRRKMSPESRARIAAAQKARWAKRKQSA